MNRTVENLSAKADDVLQGLEIREASLDRTKDRFLHELTIAKEQITEARKLIEDQKRTMAVLQDEITASKELTIPSLVASHDLVLKRIQADIAAQAIRVVQSQPIRDDV